MSEPFSLGSIRRLDVKPGETLVITFRDPMTREEFEMLASEIRRELPDGIKTLFVSDNVELDVISTGSD